MPLKIDTIPKSDTKLLAALLNFMKREHNEENYLFFFDKGNNEAIYKKYIIASAPKQVNLPSAITRPLEALAAVKNWNGMTPGIKAAKASIAKLVNGDAMPRFDRSPEYAAYLKAKNP